VNRLIKKQKTGKSGALPKEGGNGGSRELSSAMQGVFRRENQWQGNHIRDLTQKGGDTWKKKEKTNWPVLGEGERRSKFQ